MLDTNMASYIIKGKPANVRKRLVEVPMESICISVITEAELLRGLAKVPEATRLADAIKEFLIRVEILTWNSVVANAYANLRTACEKEGKALSAMDMLIAAHSVAVKATLITNDKAFYQVGHLLTLEDWS
jgi:tRNA(fMet)-specific endonuclease VapC